MMCDTDKNETIVFVVAVVGGMDDNNMAVVKHCAGNDTLMIDQLTVNYSK